MVFTPTTKNQLILGIKYWTINAGSKPAGYTSDIRFWDVSNMTDFRDLFRNNLTFNADISRWDVSNVTTFQSMFENAKAFNQDISGWKINTNANVIMAFMFRYAHAFNQDISAWDTSRVTNMSSMFQGAISFNQNLNAWDTSKVTAMAAMFMDAHVFNSDISSWNTSSVISMASMFQSARAFNQDISSWNTSNVQYMANMFSSAEVFNQRILNWDTSSVTTINGMFYRANAFNNGNYNEISYWDLSNVTNFQSMFHEARAFNQDISGWKLNTNADAKISMIFMFRYAVSFNQDISAWNMSRVIKTNHMFWGAMSFNQDISAWDTSSMIETIGMFEYASAFNQDISSWNVSSVIKMSNMFKDAKAFNQSLNGWDTSNVTDMAGMFSSTYNAPLNAFNSDISQWDTSNVTNMASMFGYARNFNQRVSDWNTSKVTNMAYMFYQATNFNNGDYDGPSLWDTSNVTNFRTIFWGCMFNNMDVSTWDTSSAIDTHGMFSGNINFNRNISNWDISKSKDMIRMFQGCKSLNQDLSRWSPDSANNFSQTFSQCEKLDFYIGDWFVGRDSSESFNFGQMFYFATIFNNKWGLPSSPNISMINNLERLEISTPYPPLNFTAVLITDTYDIQLSWETPIKGSLPTYYQIELDQALTRNYTVLDTTTETSYLISDLQEGETFTFKVTSINEAGEGGYVVSDDITIVVPAPAPQNITVNQVNDSIIVNFDEPTSDGGDPIDGYNIIAIDVNNSSIEIELVADTQSIDLSYTVSINNLEYGSTYSIKVAAINDAGIGVYGINQTPFLYVVEPSIVQNVNATSGDYKSTLVSWDPPESDGGSDIIGYYILYKKSSDSEYIQYGDLTNKNAKVIENLENGVEYYFIVSAASSKYPNIRINEVSPNIVTAIPDMPIISTIPDTFYLRLEKTEGLTIDNLIENDKIDTNESDKIVFNDNFTKDLFPNELLLTESEIRDIRNTFIKKTITYVNEVLNTEPDTEPDTEPITNKNLILSTSNLGLPTTVTEKSNYITVLTTDKLSPAATETISTLDIPIDNGAFYVVIDDPNTEFKITNVTRDNGIITIMKNEEDYEVIFSDDNGINETYTLNEGEDITLKGYFLQMGSIVGLFLGIKTVSSSFQLDSSTLWSKGISASGNTRYSRLVVSDSTSTNTQLEVSVEYFNNIARSPISTTVHVPIKWGNLGQYLWWDYTWSNNPSGIASANIPSSFFSGSLLTFVIENPIGSSGWSIIPSAYDHTATLPNNQLMWGNGAFRGQGYNSNPANYPYIDYTQFYQDTNGALLDYSGLAASNSGESVSITTSTMNPNTIWWNDDTGNPMINATINRTLKYLTFSVEMPYLDDITTSAGSSSRAYTYILSVSGSSHESSTSSIGNGYWIYHIEEASSGNFPSTGSYHGQFHYQSANLAIGTWDAGSGGYVIRNNSPQNSESGGSKTKLHISIGLPNDVNLSIESIGITFFKP
jgi:surface protein